MSKARQAQKSNSHPFWAECKVRHVARLLPIILGIIVFFFYVFTLAPTVLWGDSAKLAQFVHEHQLSIQPEYHPLHTLIGMLFSVLPGEDLAFKLNLMSALFGALTIVFVYLIILRLTHSVIGATAGAVSLAVSHVFWHLSVITETYTFFCFLLAGVILCMLKWDNTEKEGFLFAACFLVGISISLNYLMPFFLPAFIYFYFSHSRNRSNLFKKLAPAFIAFVIGLIAWIAVAFMSDLESLVNLWHGGAFSRYYRSIGKLTTEIVRYPLYLAYQFPFIAFPVGLLGAWHNWRTNRRQFQFLLILFVCDVLFACGYMRQKQFYLLLPSFIVFAAWIGVGFSSFYFWLHTRSLHVKTIAGVLACSLVVMPNVLYYSIPKIADGFQRDFVGARTLPYRDNSRFFLLPDKHNEYGAKRYAEEAFAIVEPDSIIIADFTPIAVLRYFQNVLGVRKDVWLKLVDFEPLDVSFVDKYIMERSIYLADDLEPDYNISGLKVKYNLTSIGPILKITPKLLVE